MINQLLKKDAKGNLKPNRILDLRNMADKIGNEELSAGVDIVLQSYKPSRSVIFVEADSLVRAASSSWLKTSGERLSPLHTPLCRARTTRLATVG